MCKCTCWDLINSIMTSTSSSILSWTTRQFFNSVERIITWLIQIFVTSPCNKFKTWMLVHHNIHDYSGALDPNNFMSSGKNKSWKVDSIWKSLQETKEGIEKKSDAVALNSRILSLVILIDCLWIVRFWCH